MFSQSLKSVDTYQVLFTSFHFQFLYLFCTCTSSLDWPKLFLLPLIPARYGFLWHNLLRLIPTQSSTLSDHRTDWFQSQQLSHISTRSCRSTDGRCLCFSVWTTSTEFFAVYWLLCRCCTSSICMLTSMNSSLQFPLWKVRRPWKRSLLEVIILQQLRHTFPCQAEAYRFVIVYKTWKSVNDRLKPWLNFIT